MKTKEEIEKEIEDKIRTALTEIGLQYGKEVSGVDGDGGLSVRVNVEEDHINVNIGYYDYDRNGPEQDGFTIHYQTTEERLEKKIFDLKHAIADDANLLDDPTAIKNKVVEEYIHSEKWKTEQAIETIASEERRIHNVIENAKTETSRRILDIKRRLKANEELLQKTLNEKLNNYTSKKVK